MPISSLQSFTGKLQRFVVKFWVVMRLYIYILTNYSSDGYFVSSINSANDFNASFVCHFTRKPTFAAFVSLCEEIFVYFNSVVYR